MDFSGEYSVFNFLKMIADISEKYMDTNINRDYISALQPWNIVRV